MKSAQFIQLSALRLTGWHSLCAVVRPQATTPFAITPSLWKTQHPAFQANSPTQTDAVSAESFPKDANRRSAPCEIGPNFAAYPTIASDISFTTILPKSPRTLAPGCARPRGGNSLTTIHESEIAERPPSWRRRHTRFERSRYATTGNEYHAHGDSLWTVDF